MFGHRTSPLAASSLFLYPNTFHNTHESASLCEPVYGRRGSSCSPYVYELCEGVENWTLFLAFPACLLRPRAKKLELK